MESAVALAPGGHMKRDDLSKEIRQMPRLPTESLKEPVQLLQDVERDYILAALEMNNGNQTRTAEQLQIGLATLCRKLKKYNQVGRSLKPPNTSDGKSDQSK
jgi:DNA-binding NtrC family response regulator